MRSLHALALFAALLLSAVLPAQIGVNTVSYHGVSHATHQNNFLTLPGQGFRLISLNVTGGWSNATYSAVWMQVSGPAWVSSHGMTLAQYTSQRATWETQGYRAKIVSASGSGTNKVFAAVYVNDGVTTVHTVDRTRTQFENDVVVRRNAGYRLVSCGVYGAALAPLFAPVFERESEWIGWGATVSTLSQYSGHVAEYVLADARPVFVETNDFGIHVSTWNDERYGAWTWVDGRTSAQLTADKSTFAAQGLYPLCISGSGSGTGTTYSAFFVQRISALPRTLVHSGPASIPLNAYDQFVDSLVQECNIRGATLAVIRDGRLSYARGYGYAESGTAAPSPTAPFRLGGISKALTGMVAHRLIQDGTGNLTLGTRYVNYLGISNYASGGATVDVQKLLMHTAGLNDPVDANEITQATWANPSNPQLPCDESVIGAWTIQNTITAQGNYSYSDAGPTMVGQMIEQATGQSYITALNASIGTPFGVSFTRMQPLKNQRVLGEVAYFPRNLSLRDGNLWLDQRLMAPQYCQRLWDASGGVVGSAIELARVVAGSFQIASDSPVFSEQTQAGMLVHYSPLLRGSTSLTADVTASGWHWYDSGARTCYYQSGSQDGFYCYCMFRSDGVGAVLCLDGNPDAAHIDAIRTGLEDAADAVTDWPTTDRFPSYGYPSFPLRPRITGGLYSTPPNVSRSPILIVGHNLDLVTHATFAGHTLLPGDESDWENGYLEPVSPDWLYVHLPQGLVPGAQPLTVFSPTLASAPQSITISLAWPFQVAAPNSVVGDNTPFGVYAARGQLPSNSFVVLGFSSDNLASTIPGTVSLGIGNNFSSLFTSDLRTFDPVTGLTRWSFPGMFGFSPLYLQAAALVPGAANPFPVPVTSVIHIDRH